MKRTELLETLKLAAPALLAESEVVLPVLKSFRFEGGQVFASNDVISVCIGTEVEIDCTIPGRKLITFLGSCSTKEAKLAIGKTGKVLATCGKSRLQLANNTEDEWPIEFPDIEEAETIALSEDFFAGLDLCSSQVPDTGVGAWQGGVIFYIGENLEIFAVGRGRSTISAYTVDGVVADHVSVEEAVVPSSFCKAAVAMSKVYGDEAQLHLTKEGAVIDWGDGANIIACKFVNADMPDISSKFDAVMEEERVHLPITEEMQDAFKRASQLGDRGTCTITSEENALVLKTKSEGGAALTERIKVDDPGELDIEVAADLISRRMDLCETIGFGNNASVMQNESGSFIYVAANRGDREEEE